MTGLILNLSGKCIYMYLERCGVIPLMNCYIEKNALTFVIYLILLYLQNLLE